MEAKAIIHVQRWSWSKSEMLLNKTTRLNGIITAISRTDDALWMRDETSARTNKSSGFGLNISTFPMT